MDLGDQFLFFLLKLAQYLQTNYYVDPIPSKKSYYYG